MRLRLPRVERRWKAGVTALLRLLFRSSSVAPPRAEEVRRVLVIRQHNQLGDMHCVVPLLRSIRQFAPHAELTLLAGPANAEPMLHHRLLNEVMVFDKRTLLSSWSVRPLRLYRTLRDLRRRRFDLVIVPATVSVSFTSDFLAYATGSRWRVGAGSIDGKRNPGAFLYTNPAELDWRGTNRHQVLRNWDVVSGLLPEPDNLGHEITLTRDELRDGIAFVSNRLSQASVTVLLHPGAGKPPNRWPADRFARLAEEMLGSWRARIFVSFGPMDDDVRKQIETALGERVEYIVNQPVRRVASILASVDLAVSNDTGIMHLAAGVGTPVLSLFGPTDPAQWAPLGGRNRFIKGEGDTLANVDVRQVYEAARSMLRMAGKEEIVGC